MSDRTGIARSGSNSLIYEVVGSGPKLLFIGGTGWDIRATPTPLQSPLTKHFTIAFYDQRGMGRSDKPKGPYSMRDYADDARAVLNALGWERSHVVGYSFGGMVAQEVAINYPDKVDRLVLAASTPGGPEMSSFPVHTLVDLDPYERARKGLEIADLTFTKSYQMEHRQAAVDRVLRRVQAQTRFSHEPDAKHGLWQQLMARAEHDCTERLKDIQANTLVLAGKGDGQAGFEIQKEMAKNIVKASFIGVDGSHNFLFENDEAYALISQFLMVNDGIGKTLK